MRDVDLGRLVEPEELGTTLLDADRGQDGVAVAALDAFGELAQPVVEALVHDDAVLAHVGIAGLDGVEHALHESHDLGSRDFEAVGNLGERQRFIDKKLEGLLLNDEICALFLFGIHAISLHRDRTALPRGHLFSRTAPSVW